MKIFLLFLSIMILSTENVMELIKKPKNSTLVKEAVQEEKLLKAYATGQDKYLIVNDCLKLLVEKRKKFFSDSFGMHTKPLLDRVSTHFYRVFSATGKVIQNKFWDSKQQNDFEDYISKCYESSPNKLNGISNEQYYKHQGLESILFEPNSIVMIDFANTNQKRNEPYVNTIKINQIHDIDASIRGIEYLIVFNEIKRGQSKIKQYFVLDDLSYSVYENKFGKLELVSQNTHDFGFVPARHISSYNKYKGNYSIKKSPISDSLDDLYAWLLLKNFSKIYSWEAGVPDKLEPVIPCNNRHHTGVFCESGYFKLTDGSLIRCESCDKEQKERMAWGKVFNIPLSYLEKDASERLMKMFSAVKFDTSVMTFHENDLKEKEEKIIADIIGKSQATVTKSKEARNEIDVQSDTEDMKRVLYSVSEIIEQTWQFTDTLIAQSRQYNSFSSINIFLGRGYLLQTKEKYYNEYKLLREAGADDFILNQKLFEITQSEYGSDKSFIDLFELLAGIIPFRHLSNEQIYANFDKYKINEQTELDLYVRLYAATWIQEIIQLNDINIWGKEATQESKFEELRRFIYDKASEIKSKNKNISIV